jgi:hypothetical protein
MTHKRTAGKLNRRGDDRIMSPCQLIDRLVNSNLYDLLAFLVWYAKRDEVKITCIDCIETRKDMSNIPPDCVKCGLPTAKLLEKYFNINPYKEKMNEKTK